MRSIQLQATVKRSITEVIEDVRKAVSSRCGGIDDMHLMGKKALVVRAEIYPSKLAGLLESLATISIAVRASSIPDEADLDADTEYTLMLQLVSLAGDTDSRVEVPRVPG